MKTPRQASKIADDSAERTARTVKPAHTPGPWKQCPGPDYGSEDEKRSSQIFIQTDGRSVVAEARRMATFGKVQDTDLANARLIAAAPELLEALWRLLGTTDPGNADEHELGCRCVIHEARAAIAKATLA